MSYKLRPRLGSAIASTILSLFSAVSLVGVDKAQAAVLNYSFYAGDYNSENFGAISYHGYFTVDNSSLTERGVERVMVSEGTFYGLKKLMHNSSMLLGFNDLTESATAIFYQGDFRGLYTAGSIYRVTRNNYGRSSIPGNVVLYEELIEKREWLIDTQALDDPSMWTSKLSAYTELLVRTTGTLAVEENYIFRENLDSAEVYYTLYTEPVPEPLTAGGTALALAGLSWLKHKKKMAA
jgi:hypothetical protein